MALILLAAPAVAAAAYLISKLSGTSSPGAAAAPLTWNKQPAIPLRSETALPGLIDPWAAEDTFKAAAEAAQKRNEVLAAQAVQDQQRAEYERAELQRAAAAQAAAALAQQRAAAAQAQAALDRQAAASAQARAALDAQAAAEAARAQAAAEAAAAADLAARNDEW